MPARSTLITLTWLLTLGLASLLIAGTTYELTCTNKACKHIASLSLGGGRAFAEASGYCSKCANFTSIQWKRGTPEPDPIKVWNPATGDTLTLHKCPKCTTPFIVIPKIEDVRRCPKCNQPGLQAKPGIMFD